MKIINLFDNKVDPVEAIEEAEEMRWQDIICLGYNENGGFQLCSSSMDNKTALMLVEILKCRIMKEFG